MNFKEIAEKLQELKTSKTLRPTNEKDIFCGAISLPQDCEEFDIFQKGAKFGLIGHYYYLPLMNHSSGNFFSRKDFFYSIGTPAWNSTPMFVELDKIQLTLEFGKIKRQIDAEDLQKRGISVGIDSVEASILPILQFIKSLVIKTDDDFLARKALKTLFNRGLFYSCPIEACLSFPNLSFMQHPEFKKLKFTKLNVYHKDFVCPRCEHHFRNILRESFPDIARMICPKCGVKFGTKI